LALARIYPNNDTAALGVVQRSDDAGVGQCVGREVDRELGGGDESRVDRVESLLGGEVDFLRRRARRD